MNTSDFGVKESKVWFDWLIDSVIHSFSDWLIAVCCNVNRDSLLRGWELLAVCLSFFPPSVKFQSYLEGHIFRCLDTRDHTEYVCILILASSALSEHLSSCLFDSHNYHNQGTHACGYYLHCASGTSNISSSLHKLGKLYQNTTFLIAFRQHLLLLATAVAFLGMVLITSDRRQMSRRTACHKYGKVDRTPRLCSSNCLVPSLCVLLL